MKQLLTPIFVFLVLICSGQTIREMTPSLGHLVDVSPEKEIEFIKNQQKCETIWEKLSNQNNNYELTKEEKLILENCSETRESIWNIIGIECSWYCGAGQDTISASSSLKPFNGLRYFAKNSHDLSYETAWVEGVPGYGIGEFLVYHFPPENPRITKIIVVNGYVKSEQAWLDNSRVKKIKMYVDNKPYAILNLADSRQEQIFSVEPIGNSDRTDWKRLSSLSWWTIKFEIMDVYKGRKYDDTAITEIYFDGIDVH